MNLTENEADYLEEDLSTHLQSHYRKNGSSWPDPNAIQETSVAVTNEDLSSVEKGQVTKEDTTQSNQEKSSQENYSESERAVPQPKNEVESTSEPVQSESGSDLRNKVETSESHTLYRGTTTKRSKPTEFNDNSNSRRRRLPPSLLVLLSGLKGKYLKNLLLTQCVTNTGLAFVRQFLGIQLLHMK